MEQIEQLKKAIDEARKIVIFSGAGLSTNSGIPDFRSADGLYNQKEGYKVAPEEIISHSYFYQYPEEFFKFYFEKMIYPNALPNVAHKYFADLERHGKDVKVVTQNIDSLHQMAGSTDVIELHGSVMRNYCTKCHKFYPLKDIYNKECKVPYCKCGGIIKPDVVLYEEPLNEDAIERAISAISDADMLIIVGTSLTVYPAAGFIRYYRGDKLVLLNKSETQYDSYANIAIHDDIKNVIEELKKD